MSDSFSDALITRGYASCPDCFARLVGYADVTLHPTIKVTNGRLSLGKYVDSPASIAEGVQLAVGSTLTEELYCSRACGYRIPARLLREQIRRG